MPYELSDRLVVGIASSALFDLEESNAVFEEEGEEAYRRYQEYHFDDTLTPGVAFPFVRRLLSLNDLAPSDDPLVEVIILSRNDPDTGMRVLESVQSHGLPITRAVFMQGRSPYRFMPAFNMSLFLSKNKADVAEAVARGLPAGQVLHSPAVDDDHTEDLRIAFDFDGVLASDESERIMQESGNLHTFHAHEIANRTTPHNPGPLKTFLAAINRIQDREEARRLEEPDYRIRLHVALVTARNAPSHERAVKSLKEWGVRVNDAFFLGGVEKARVLEILKPHIFFDDQETHLGPAAKVAPSVHVPFGLINQGHVVSSPPPAAVPESASYQASPPASELA